MRQMGCESGLGIKHEVIVRQRFDKVKRTLSGSR